MLCDHPSSVKTISRISLKGTKNKLKQTEFAPEGVYQIFPPLEDEENKEPKANEKEIPDTQQSLVSFWDEELLENPFKGLYDFFLESPKSSKQKDDKGLSERQKEQSTSPDKIESTATKERRMYQSFADRVVNIIGIKNRARVRAMPRTVKRICRKQKIDLAAAAVSKEEETMRRLVQLVKSEFPE